MILPGAPDAPPALGATHRPPPLPEPWCPELRDQRLSGLSLAPRTEGALAAWLLASSPADASTPIEAAPTARRLLAFELGRDFVRETIAAFACYFTGGFLDDFFVRDFFGDMAMPFVWDGCPGLVQRWTAPSDFLRASLLCHLFNAGCNAAAHAGDRARSESWLRIIKECMEHALRGAGRLWELSERVLGACMEVHRHLGPGLLESRGSAGERDCTGRMGGRGDERRGSREAAKAQRGRER